MDLADIGTELIEAAQGVQDHTVELRRAIHADPELGLDLPKTQKKILEALDGLGLDITTGEALTSVVADLDTGKPGPTILLRGDMDALPLQEDLDVAWRSQNEQMMHACGHDAHVAMLLSAARLLSENKSELTGKIRFMFQPGEEGYHGAKYMIEEGVLDGVDRAFAIHVFTQMRSGHFFSRGGALMASADRFEITINGSGGHASMPHGCVDPIPAAASTVLGLHAMVGRTTPASEAAVLTVSHLEAGTTNNIIPHNAFMEGTIRTLNEDVRSTLHTNLMNVANHNAQAHNCSCNAEIIAGYPVTINNEEEVQRAAAVAEAVVGEGSFHIMREAVMGAEDWSYVLNKVPGSMAFLGVCAPDLTPRRGSAQPFEPDDHRRRRHGPGCRHVCRHGDVAAPPPLLEGPSSRKRH